MDFYTSGPDLERTDERRHILGTPVEPPVSLGIPGDPWHSYEGKIMSGGNNYGWRMATDCQINTEEYHGVRSPLKYLVLDLIEARDVLTYSALAEETGMPESYAADKLVKYARQGLLERDREGEGGLSRFRLTPHGRDRLFYFRRQ